MVSLLQTSTCIAVYRAGAGICCSVLQTVQKGVQYSLKADLLRSAPAEGAN